nr:hypothetical protein [Tanacetum cinerariifolium]
MSVKDSTATQTCELSKEESNDFLTLYPIPSEYRVILLKSNQTIFDAPPSIAARIKDKKYKTEGGSSRPPFKGKLALGSSTSHATRAKISSLKEDVPFLTVSDDDEGKLLVIMKLRGMFDVMRSKERAREEECKGLQVKCNAAMTEFEKNLDEVEELMHDRREVVSKLVPYAATKLVYSDDMRSLVGKLMSFAIVYGRCKAFEQASNILATATFLWLDEFVGDPSAPIEALLSKKPPTLQRPAPSRTQVLLPSS